MPIKLGRLFLATDKTLVDVEKEELRLMIQDEEVTFNVFNGVKYLVESDSFFSLDVVEAVVSSHVGQADLLETSLFHGDYSELVNEKVKDYLMWMGSFSSNKGKYFESLGASPSPPIQSIEKPPILEEKPLLTHHRFSYLGPSSILPVIISSFVLQFKEEKLLRVLREHKGTIAWSLTDIKGLMAYMFMHRIL